MANTIVTNSIIDTDSDSSNRAIQIATDMIQASLPTAHSGSNDSPNEPPVCQYFLRGGCWYGESCRNIHPEGVTTGSSADSPSNKRRTSPKQKHSRSRVNDEAESYTAEKKQPMRTATDVIQRIQWDADLLQSDFVVGYLDRFVGIIEQPFGMFNWNDIALADEDDLAIPRHRIQYFKYRNTVVWDKRERLDDFFGSTGGRKIYKVIAETTTEEENNEDTHITQAEEERGVIEEETRNSAITNSARVDNTWDNL